MGVHGAEMWGVGRTRPRQPLTALWPTACSPWPNHARVPLPRAPAQFCYRLTREAGVTLIPASAFYADNATAPRSLVRFVFCKTDEKLQAACDKLRTYLAAQR